MADRANPAGVFVLALALCLACGYAGYYGGSVSSNENVHTMRVPLRLETTDGKVGATISKEGVVALHAPLVLDNAVLRTEKSRQEEARLQQKQMEAQKPQKPVENGS